MDTITIDNGKKIDYKWHYANSQGVTIHVETKLTKEERKEFKSKVSDDHDIVSIYFL